METHTTVENPRCVVRFWGVRGSIPTPGPGTMEYGGNTACVEVRADGEIIVLDAGTGLRPLGLALNDEFGESPIRLTLLITHTHWDHIQGFPFFAPIYSGKNSIRIIGFEGSRSKLRATLAGQMESPYFPIAMTDLPSSIVIEELGGMEFDAGPVKVRACYANHPGITAGYRIETSAGSIVYLPDNESIRPDSKPHDGPVGLADQTAEETRRRQVDFVRGAKVLIIDAQYDEEEFEGHRGWGHGCVTDVADFAMEAGVERLFLFHHDPAHDDEAVAHMVDLARHRVADAHGQVIVAAAREGAELALE